MTLDDFCKTWEGKFCEWGGTPDALNQCVDEANAYIQQVLNLPPIFWTNAIDFPSKAGEKYEYIENTPEGIPQRGDLVIWKPSPGHIAIFLDGDANNFRSFDQNFPLGSPCHIQDHNYTNVIGWLHPKDTYYKGYNLSDAESMKVCVDVFLKVMNKEYVSKNEYDTVISANNLLQKAINEGKKTNDALQADCSELQTKNNNLQSLIDQLQEKLAESQSQEPIKDYETIANIRAFGHHYGVVKFLNE